MPGSRAGLSKRKTWAAHTFASLLSLEKSKRKFTHNDKPAVTLSDPEAFRHECHIGCKPTGALEVKNIPDDWIRFFEAANLSPRGATPPFDYLLKSCIDIKQSEAHSPFSSILSTPPTFDKRKSGAPAPPPRRKPPARMPPSVPLLNLGNEL